MAVSFDDVKALLDPDEPDYVFAGLLGADAVPHLATLVAGPDPMLASKAAYLAGMIGDKAGADVVAAAARSSAVIVRIAAAGTARNLFDQTAGDILLPLLTDPEPGVRLNALKSVPATAGGELRAAVQRLAAGPVDKPEQALSVAVLERSDAGPAVADSPAVGFGSPAAVPGMPAVSASVMPEPEVQPGEMPALGGSGSAAGDPAPSPMSGLAAPGEMPGPVRPAPGEMPA